MQISKITLTTLLMSLLLVADVRPPSRSYSVESSSIPKLGFNMLRPLPPYEVKGYETSSPPGFRKSPMGGLVDGLHRGEDMVPREILEDPKANVAVAAVESGIVVTVYPPPGRRGGVRYRGHPIYGGMVVIHHPQAGIYTLYGHLKDIWVSEGTRIERGAKFGLVGNTGISTGPHLHYEQVVDPEYILQLAEDARFERERALWKARR